MKKLFAILAVASVMTACNGAGEEKAAATDSPKTENLLLKCVAAYQRQQSNEYPLPTAPTR